MLNYKISQIGNQTRKFFCDLMASHYRGIIIGVSLLMILAVGLSGLVLSSNFAPLLVMGAVAAFLAILIFLTRPHFAWYLAVMIVFLPGGIIDSQIQSYLNRGMVVVVFAFWLFSFIMQRKKMVIPAASWFMLVFLLWGLLSLCWIDRFDHGQEMIQSYILRWLLFLFLSVNLMDTWKKLDGVMNMLALIGLIMAIASIVSVIISGYTPGTRLKVFGMNENGTGILLLCALIGVLWWADSPGKRYLWVRRFLAVVYLLVSIVVIALSGSRGSALSLMGILFMFLFWKSTRRWTVLSMVFIIIVLIAGTSLFTTTLERMTISGLYGDTVLGGREGIWRAAWMMIQNHPLVGVGIGGSDYSILRYFSNVLIEPSVLPLETWTAEGVSIHNPVLTIWSEVGAVGLVFYLGIMIAAILSFIRVVRHSQDKTLQRYFPLVASIFIGYILSWVKGGGMEVDHSYFLMLSLLLFPGVIANKSTHTPKISSPT